METASGLIRLKPNSQQTLEEWTQTLSDRLDEVRATLRSEGVEIESWFQIEIDHQHYLLWYMRAASIKKAFEIFQQSTRAIDLYHREQIGRIMVENGNFVAEPLLDVSVR
jgi:hypothetical protein